MSLPLPLLAPKLCKSSRPRIRFGHLASCGRDLVHVRLALEPLLRGEDRRRDPGAKLGRGNDGDGPAERTAQALARRRRRRRRRVAQCQSKGDEATKVEDGVEGLNAHRRQPVGHDHALLPHGDFEVDDRDNGHARRKDEELQSAGARSVRYTRVPVVDYLPPSLVPGPGRRRLTAENRRGFRSGV